ncbi:hypothetical protein CPC08DRAFT_650684 [Agrocybe pediades]|nr:hypothetical protein CPC08DRAFT_650684 [Agrocybe pediades]
MHDGFQLVARVPYPVTQPKFYALASEVATMAFLHAHGLPVPEVYGYSATPDNAAKTEYIFMEFVKGTKLTDMWMQLKEADLVSILHQIVKLESQFMSIPFPAGGSLYYADDLSKVAGEKTGIQMSIKGKQFCIGPDVRLHMWYGRRSELDIDRGPYENVESVLAAPALKEIAYLECFGQPLQPFQRWRREAYKFEKQPPMDHIKNLQRYLLMAPSLIPNDENLRAFCLRHPDLNPSNIMVSTSPDSGQLEIVSLLDWQHASILPRFLVANIPDRFQNYDDPFSQYLIPPTLPPIVDKMEKSELVEAVQLYRARLIHYHYAKGTEEFNKVHHDALSDLASLFIRRLWYHAGVPWEGETHDLKALLVDVTEKWEKLTQPGVPCPVVFEPDEVRATKLFSRRLQKADSVAQGIQGMIGYETTETWVPINEYTKAKHAAEQLKEKLLMHIPVGETRDKIRANWLLDDMPDEKDYM